MIKLIATDLDGTVLPEGSFDLNPEYLDVIRRLHDKGCVFVAASGRHYSSMRTMFQKVSNDLIYLCGNGSYVSCREVPMETRCLEKDLAVEIIRAFRLEKADYICLDLRDKALTDTYQTENSRRLFRWAAEGYRVNIQRCADLTKTEDPILKVAMFLNDDAAPAASRLQKQFEGRANIMAAGRHWVDAVALNTDKGNALAVIQKQLGILPEETIAFGDNDNDIGMLRLAGTSYAVAGARESVKAAATHVLGPMEDDAVLGVLTTLL